jgi:MoxR-like ATPase
VILTSNRPRELHEALKRRCLYHWIDHPSFEREVAIVGMRAPDAGIGLVREAGAFVARLRELALTKPPGVAETVDWVQALHALSEPALTPEAVDVTLGAVVKQYEDLERVHAHGISALVAAAKRDAGTGDAR